MTPNSERAPGPKPLWLIIAALIVLAIGAYLIWSGMHDAFSFGSQRAAPAAATAPQ